MSIPGAKRDDVDPLKSAEGIEKAFPPAMGDGIVLLPLESVSSGIAAARAVMGALKCFCYWIARGVLAPCEVAFRYNIGERYFNIITVMVFVIGTTLVYAQGKPGRIVAFCLGVTFWFGYAVHMRRCRNAFARSAYIHSYSEGESFLRVHKFDASFASQRRAVDFSKQYIEPILLAALGLGLGFDPGKMKFLFMASPKDLFAMYFFAAGCIMAIYQFFLWRERLTALLDEIDARLVAEAKQLAGVESKAGELKVHQGIPYIASMAPQTWSKAWRAAPSSKNDSAYRAPASIAQPRPAPKAAPLVESARPQVSNAPEAAVKGTSRPVEESSVATPPVAKADEIGVPPSGRKFSTDSILEIDATASKFSDPTDLAFLELVKMAEHLLPGSPKRLGVVREELEQFARKHSGTWLAAVARIRKIETYPRESEYQARVMALISVLNDPGLPALGAKNVPYIKALFPDGDLGQIPADPFGFVLYSLCETYVSGYDLERAQQAKKQIRSDFWLARADTAISPLSELPSAEISYLREVFLAGQSSAS